jgi:hypothetical protein
MRWDAATQTQQAAGEGEVANQRRPDTKPAPGLGMDMDRLKIGEKNERDKERELGKA